MAAEATRALPDGLGFVLLGPSPTCSAASLLDDEVPRMLIFSRYLLLQSLLLEHADLHRARAISIFLRAPLALEATELEIGGDDAVAGNIWVKGVVAQG